MKGNPNEATRTPGEQAFLDQLSTIQKDYERRRARLAASIEALDRDHTEWMQLPDGDKYATLRMLDVFKKRGEECSVYSESVRTATKHFLTEIDARAAAAKERLMRKLPFL